MESKKIIITSIIVLTVSVLVGIGVWYGLNYFKGDNEKTNAGNTNNYKEVLNKKIQGNKLEFISDFYRSSEEIIDSILHEESATCFKTNYDGNTLIISYPEGDEKYKFSGVNDEIKCAYIDKKIGNIKLEKAVDRKIKKIDLAKSKESIISIEFE